MTATRLWLRPMGAAPFLLTGLLVVACSSAGGQSASPAAAASDPVVVHVVLTNAGCEPDRSSVPAGSIEFSITNEGGDAVAELELKQGERIVGERENLAPGLSGSFTLDLEPGSYVLECPGATTEETDFEVVPAQ